MWFVHCAFLRRVQNDTMHTATGPKTTPQSSLCELMVMNNAMTWALDDIAPNDLKWPRY